MKENILFILLLIISIQLTAQSKIDPKNIKPQYGFIENNGQVKDQQDNPRNDVKFILPLSNNNVVLTATGFSYNTYVSQERFVKKSTLYSSYQDSLERKITFKYHRIDIEFIGANNNPKIVTEDPADDYINYFLNDSQIKVQHFSKVRYKEIYPGVDVEFIARPGGSKPVEYNFIVQPGADMSQIKLKYVGANSSRLRKGKLEFSLDHGILTESIPSSYTERTKKSVKIKYFELKSSQNRTTNNAKEISVGFSGDVSSLKEAVIIDPTPDLLWATYYGGIGGESGDDISSDAAGNIYVVGSTQSSLTMASNDAFQFDYGQNTDAFVAKFSADGKHRIWSTYYGGAGFDYAHGVKIDDSFNVYFCGETSSLNSIATSGTERLLKAGQNDAFLVKLNSSGGRIWGTYYGGDEGDAAYTLEIDKLGNIILGGFTYSESLIATTSSYQYDKSGYDDGFLAKFNSSGLLIWATYYGGSGQDYIQMIKLDNSGNIYLTGGTDSSDAMATQDALQSDFAGDRPGHPVFRLPDAFIAKFNSSGFRVWSTYFGGLGSDEAFDIALDRLSNVYVVGTTHSSGMATPTAHQTTYGGETDSFVGGDIFVLKLNSEGKIDWSTYYGGTANEGLPRVITDNSGNVYLAGWTYSSGGISTQGTLQGTNLINGFFAKFDPSGNRQWGTYFSGPVGGMEFDTYGDLIFIGIATLSHSNIATPGAYQSNTTSNSWDIYIGKFSLPCTSPTITGLDIGVSTYLCATKFFIDENRLTGCQYSFTWSFGDGTSSQERGPMHLFDNGGTYNVSLVINYQLGQCTENEITITKQITPNTLSSALENMVIDVETDIKYQVITTSAVTFSDVWPLPHDNAALSNKCSYLNGSQGIWRNNASYVYNVPRQLSPVTNVAKDGTFTLNQFDWATAPLNIVPNWIEANSMTKYSPYSYELENQDVLGVYSAALYDYGGHLPSANGVNMRHAEMGFTSFEYKEGLETPDQKGKPSGNWMLSNVAQSATLVYKVPVAMAYMAVVDASPEELDLVQKVDVAASAIQPGLFFLIGRRPFNFLQDVPILCKQAHPTDPAKSIIVLARAPFEGLWTGSITVKRMALPSVDGAFDDQIAHSGKKSLKITSLQTFRQEMFELEAGKSYWINAWVSIAQPNLPTPLLANGIGIEIALKNKQGQEVGKFLFEPVGTIIEGWQQIKGTFVSSIKNPLVEITFKPGSGGITAWYDDLRLQPEEGNMKAYVYDLNDYRLHAILDEENYASFFYYDAEGNLYLTKKETEKGVKTISENISYQVEKH